MTTLSVVESLIRDHWPAIVVWLLGLALGAWWGRHRARRQWERKEFLHRLNVSLTTIEDGVLRIRTLLEKDIFAIFLNQQAVQRVLDAARHTTETDPILPVAKEDAWYLLNAVLNEISERFAPGLLKRDMGLDVTSTRYLVCLTHEVAGRVRTQKVRAMVVRRHLLEHLPAEMPRFEDPNHVTRWGTLQRMAEAYRTRRYLFLEIEIAI